MIVPWPGSMSFAGRSALATVGPGACASGTLGIWFLSTSVEELKAAAVRASPSGWCALAGQSHSTVVLQGELRQRLQQERATGVGCRARCSVGHILLELWT